MQGLDPQGGVVADTLVHADYDLFLAFHGLLMAIRGFLDLLLGKPFSMALIIPPWHQFYRNIPKPLFQLTG